ncbi:RagB/SusD family nutrient uptake outer membrane protein [Porifericola rhodea]|uniref:RagB/SusD family nutrient uptake outer membrane protein n=1 Tax=Porifericola rhodea TaxID=930972 RepID=UPI0026653DFA|nr:RagB/SusD family nutrient uptake outer membrane protein [Porifericola rhodea]WKN32886.1 RagB/SusD family nutrient uptake outer membrane protein [Porifericola rhodea]
MSYKLYFKSLSLLVAITFAYTGCTDLEVEEVESIVAESESGEFSGDAEALLESAYNQLSSFADQANVYSLYVHTSDEMIPPTRGTDWGDNGVWRLLHSHNWDPTHQYVLNSWNQLNSRVFLTNQVLASDNPAPNAEQAAAAKFLRAFYMWHVMDLYGQVPFREVNEGAEIDPRVLSREEAFDFIVNDLEEALPDLPSTGPSPINDKASKASVNALLARLYLNKGVYMADVNEEGALNPTFDQADMAKVIEYADAVAADGYALEDDYYNNFSVNAESEIIFTNPEGAGDPQNRYFMTLHYDQNPSGWNGFTTIADFYAKFEDGDVRKGIEATPDGTDFSGIGRGFLTGQQYSDSGTVITNSRNNKPLAFEADVPLIGADTDDGYRAIKYHPADKGRYIQLRYADVYLMKAEALFRSGQTAEALEMVNELRAKRGASQLSSLDEATLLDERGRELYWEGIRRVDQIRFGTFDDTWHEKTVTESFRVLYPIPQQALDSNPNLVQNPGY